mmetsp:Transcript_143226/g.249807  ORF Transcript_143226/g.249807 Transcript_143226/m.249807 type:complete len:228 (+) Transcript_143226:164-847(+)
MGQLTGDQWLRDYEKAKKSAMQIKKEVEGRGAGGECKLEAKQAALVRGNMAHLRQDISHLQQSLMAMSQNTQAYGVTKKELSRRGDLLGQLSETAEVLQEAVKSGVRSRLNASVPPWREERADTRDIPSGDLHSASEQELCNQEDTLDFLHGTVQNLKNMGGEISNEIDLHCRLLGDLEDETDNTTGKVKRQKDRLSQLTNQSSPTCCLWVCICVMILALLVLLLLF